MPITPEPTPNPNAMKFTVGRPVGGPTTFVAGRETEDPLAGRLLALEGVSSIFLTADFVTITKRPDVGWDELAPGAVEILESHFG